MLTVHLYLKGHASQHDARRGPQSAGVEEFNIYSIQVTFLRFYISRFTSYSQQLRTFVQMKPVGVFYVLEMLRSEPACTI